MKTLIVSYSLTGNNQALATSLAQALDAEHVTITDAKRRGTGRIAMDVILKRSPKVAIPDVEPGAYDCVLFVSPVWMGCVATPLRACMEQWARSMPAYGFVSISGGADGPNPNLESELEERLGRKPAYLGDMHIADLLPQDPKPTRNDTSSYRVTDKEIRHLTDTVVNQLQDLALVQVG